VDAFLYMEGLHLRTTAREWLWGLHTEINLEREGAVNLPLEEVEAIYSMQQIGPDIDACIASFKMALQLRTLTTEGYHGFKAALSTLRRFI